MQIKTIIFVLYFLLSAGSAVSDDNAYSLAMELAPIDDTVAAIMAGDPEIVPGNGRVMVFGKLDHSGFFVEDIGGITVETPLRNQVPLIIDSSSIIWEFGGIVSILIAFELSEQEAADRGRGLRILWGGSVTGDNTLIDRIRIDPGNPASYRQFRWKEALASDADGEVPFSTITVIADSTAEYHFLWYLLPMGLIFILLTIRKVRAGARPN